MKQAGAEKFFIKIDNQYYGTLFYYELYFNDIDNLWLICNACNLQKSDSEIINWLSNQWLYGQEFLDYLGPLKDDAILKKTQNKRGLAEVAIQWFWERHAHYITITKTFLEEVKTPIQILNRKVDHIIGSGKMKRANRLQASLDFKLKLLAQIANTSDLSMAKTESESPHTSSDDEAYVKDEKGQIIQMSVEEYKRAALKTTESISMMTQQILRENITNEINKRKKHEDKSEEEIEERASKTPKIDK